MAGRKPEQPGPSDSRSQATVLELHKAAIWLGLAAALALLVLLIEPLLLVVAALVLAAMLDGGTRLLGRILPIGRGWRLLITCLGVVAFLGWTVYFAGSQIAGQFEALRTVVETQLTRVFDWATARGLVPKTNGGQAVANELMGSFDRLTSWVGSALGAVSSIAMIIVLGLFIAAEPRLYERGFAWLLPIERRADFYATSERMGYTMRRLMFGRLIGMAVEGFGTGIALSLAGVPMAALLGLLTGLLAFLPNIGSIISGILIILVGFSAGVDTGIWAIIIYVVVQVIDGNIIVPWVARKSVDLAPALILGAQLLFGTLFGIVGLALADPIVAMIKVFLEERAKRPAE
ncbi:permease [Sphingomonas sp. Root710]|uniref:AI-2E family transporter n=1 Tax=Sphingomonas sp. Root710 TaxID=1736594 RepID=UPI0006FB8D9D|nr:AI-2E family transporter [Sphingomonas sp. Root710]KRB82515.1 permease [Sphingomonas sp. Root710]